MSISGQCFCGEVRYEVDAPLRDARSCHCSRCRKAFSAQASAYALVVPESFRWTQGDALLTIYASQGDFGIAFCSRCGSTLCGLFAGAVHGVTLGCVDGDPGIEIGYHIYTGSKASWEVLPQGVTMYEHGYDPETQ